MTDSINRLHSGVTDKEYWDLRLKLFELQKQTVGEDADYEELKRDLIEDLNNYLKQERDPWDLTD